MVDEIWRDIVGYEEMYQVSNYGRVKSLSRKMNLLVGTRISNERIMIQNKHGSKLKYLYVALYKDSKRKYHRVNILVAKAFISEDLSGYTVNHKDMNSLNNHVNNLELMTLQDNIIHARANQIGKRDYKRSTYKITNLITSEIKSYNSSVKAAKAIGVSDMTIRNHANKVFSGTINKTYLIEKSA